MKLHFAISAEWVYRFNISNLKTYAFRIVWVQCPKIVELSNVFEFRVSKNQLQMWKLCTGYCHFYAFQIGFRSQDSVRWWGSILISNDMRWRPLGFGLFTHKYFFSFDHSLNTDVSVASCLANFVKMPWSKEHVENVHYKIWIWEFWTHIRKPNAFYIQFFHHFSRLCLIDTRHIGVTNDLKFDPFFGVFMRHVLLKLQSFAFWIWKVFIQSLLISPYEWAMCAHMCRNCRWNHNNRYSCTNYIWN